MRKSRKNDLFLKVHHVGQGDNRLARVRRKTLRPKNRKKTITEVMMEMKITEN